MNFGAIVISKPGAHVCCIFFNMWTFWELYLREKKLVSKQVIRQETQSKWTPITCSQDASNWQLFHLNKNDSFRCIAVMWSIHSEQGPNSTSHRQ